MNVDTKTILYMVAKRFNLKRDRTKDRLRLQKIIYLLQAHGLQLGYGFSWYKYGPYSHDLVFDAYAALGPEKEKYEELFKSLKFSPNSEQKFEQFENICGEILRDPQKLELVASVDFVRRTWHSDTKLDEFVNQFPNYKRQLFEGQEIDDGMIRGALGVCDKLRAN